MCTNWVTIAHDSAVKSASYQWCQLNLISATKMRSLLQFVTCWALIVARVASAERSWKVNHAFGDTDFVAAGSLTDGTQVRTSDLCLSTSHHDCHQ